MNIKKNLILKEVYKNFGKDFSDDNVADSFSLALLGYYYYCVRNGIDIKLSKSQSEVIKLLLKEKD